jgi:DNA-binding NarL/FixJ family response regulator
MPIKILVVDDYQPVRQHVCSALEKRAEFQIVAQAVDGLDAVQKAEELQPDLIVLDIGLPKLNGIAAARQIRKVAPKSKILFFSQETDMEIVKASFSTGASGYVVKSAAGNELFEAIETVIHGGQFVSRKCERWIPEVKDGRTTGSHSLPKDLEPSLPHKSKVVTQILKFSSTLMKRGF